MQLISKDSERIQYLVCVIDVYSKYDWVVHLTDKAHITITKVFQKILDESNSKGCKPSKLWVDKGSEL